MGRETDTSKRARREAVDTLPERAPAEVAAVSPRPAAEAAAAAAASSAAVNLEAKLYLASLIKEEVVEGDGSTLNVSLDSTDWCGKLAHSAFTSLKQRVRARKRAPVAQELLLSRPALWMPLASCHIRRLT